MVSGRPESAPKNVMPMLEGEGEGRTERGRGFGRNRQPRSPMVGSGEKEQGQGTVARGRGRVFAVHEDTPPAKDALRSGGQSGQSESPFSVFKSPHSPSQLHGLLSRTPRCDLVVTSQAGPCPVGVPSTSGHSLQKPVCARQCAPAPPLGPTMYPPSGLRLNEREAKG